jgi:hypothetical protein
MASVARVRRMSNEAEPRLNESQRRHYEVLFARLERTLVQLEAAARDDDARTALTIVESDLPAALYAGSAAGDRRGAPTTGRARSDAVAATAGRVSTAHLPCADHLRSERPNRCDVGKAAGIWRSRFVDGHAPRSGSRPAACDSLATREPVGVISAGLPRRLLEKRDEQTAKRHLFGS